MAVVSFSPEMLPAYKTLANRRKWKYPPIMAPPAMFLIFAPTPPPSWNTPGILKVAISATFGKPVVVNSQMYSSHRWERASAPWARCVVNDTPAADSRWSLLMFPCVLPRGLSSRANGASLFFFCARRNAVRGRPRSRCSTLGRPNHPYLQLTAFIRYWKSSAITFCPECCCQ